MNRAAWACTKKNESFDCAGIDNHIILAKYEIRSKVSPSMIASCPFVFLQLPLLHSNWSRSAFSHAKRGNLHSRSSASSVGSARHPSRRLCHGDCMFHFHVVLHPRLDVLSRDIFDPLGFDRHHGKPLTIPAEESIGWSIQSSALHGLPIRQKRALDTPSGCFLVSVCASRAASAPFDGDGERSFIARRWSNKSSGSSSGQGGVLRGGGCRRSVRGATSVDSFSAEKNAWSFGEFFGST